MMDAMQTARIPMAILLALELASTAGCTSMPQPCLNVAPMDDAEDEGPPPKADVGSGPVLGPCLTPLPPEDRPVTPCLEVTLPDDPHLGPCLMVVHTPEAPKGEDEEPSVGPCLRIAPPSGRAPVEPIPQQPREGEGMTARADVLDKLADTLPADVLARLRKREE